MIVRRASSVVGALLCAAPLAGQTVPPLPDSTGWGVHVLAIARAPDSAIWVGTYGQGIFVLRKGTESWERIRSSSDTAAHAISWDFVHAFGFGPRGQIWYGTVGNGWGLSTDGGKTWKNWEFRQLGPEWQYVTPDGIVTRGDTTYIATADGIKVTWDDGQAWRVITDSTGATTAKDSVWGRIRNQYILAINADAELWIHHVHGREVSEDGGRHWALQSGLGRDTSELRLPPRTFAAPHGRIALARKPERPRHTWFRRPIALTDQPYIDQTYRFGSTMGGNFQPHQGVEFNNANGTPVHAIGDGVVVHSGPAERGALTVAVKHDQRLSTPSARLYVFSVYYHNSKLLKQVGDRVNAGDVIALVGNTGRATNDHMHLEVHASPFDSTRLIVDPEVRYPPYNTNPELWIEPIPGTGMIAGQVWDSAGKPLQQARIYGLVKPQPRETPFSFIETYGPRNHSDPVYQEHFAISDVPPGTYVLGVEIDGKRVFRQVKVEPGMLTWVVFHPDSR
ncbi:MAG TPA: M23 family metallopeptidase [Gemmatimonadales bacterium]|nr:M23 family metallopeptidase [Gemmatimonadales bacterium]